jgi:hypothetical protein
MSDFPDEELPKRLDAAEAELATAEHRWYARATLLAALATGVTLLLPWTLSRRLGLSVWQLGLETQPTLALTWLAGLATSAIPLILKPSYKTQATTAITAIIAVIYLAAAWQATTLESQSDTWPGPGPAFATITSLTWLLTTATQLLAHRNHSPTPTPITLTQTITHLRTTR